MRNLLLLALIVISIQLTAQTNVNLEITHGLGSSAFQFNTTHKNDLGDEFQITRLQYYISGIVLEHDSGKFTPVPDFYELVDANSPTFLTLGSFNIGSIEAIHFAIGVDSGKNHLDPASYAASHALAPKNPNMHWGWGPGYKFLAMEGNKGPSMSDAFELHSLGDNYYYTLRIPTAGAIFNGEIMIVVKADYVEILRGLDMSGPVIEHGEQPKNIRTLQNMFSYVFKSFEGNSNTNPLPTGIETIENKGAFKVYPNPSLTGNINVNLSEELSGNSIIEVTDISGRIIDRLRVSNGVQSIQLEISNNGIYLVKLINNNVLINTEKIVVNH